ncbi:hypothetical protein CsSME_00052485 [Camellia sinensis var. sinensis]
MVLLSGKFSGITPLIIPPLNLMWVGHMYGDTSVCAMKVRSLSMTRFIFETLGSKMVIRYDSISNGRAIGHAKGKKWLGFTKLVL